jgi:hypothetical protein
MNNRKPCYTIPEPSTATHSASDKLNADGSTLTLRYDYDRYRDHDLVGVFRSGLRFQDVRAYRFRAESHCTLWHIRDVYDTLVEIEDSDWVEELRALSKRVTQRSREIHHYMIYLDSSGCYEIAARSWEALPEEEGAWDNGS